MKILIVKNNVQVEVADDIQKAFDYLRAKTPLTYELETAEINITNEFYLKKQATSGQNVYVTLNGAEKVKPYIKGKYDVVIYLYGLEDAKYKDGIVCGMTHMTSAISPAIFIELPCTNYSESISWIWQGIAHEMMHALCYLARQKGAKVVDEMDLTKVGSSWIPYFKNNDLSAVDGNFARTFANLAPHWALLSPTKPVEAPKTSSKAKVILQRIEDNGKQTIGVLLLQKDGVVDWMGMTLELPWKNNERNISCIPAGTYEMEFTMSPRFKKKTYEIKNVTNRDGIRIHVANFARQLNGCIAVGNKFKDLDKDGYLDVENSSLTLKELELELKEMPVILEVRGV